MWSEGAAARRAWRLRKARNEVLAKGPNQKLETLVEQAEPEPVGQHPVGYLVVRKVGQGAS